MAQLPKGNLVEDQKSQICRRNAFCFPGGICMHEYRLLKTDKQPETIKSNWRKLAGLLEVLLKDEVGTELVSRNARETLGAFWMA